MDFEKLKDDLIEEYGLDQTITYYYYLWNAINYVGKKWVKESFESVYGLGDETVIVADYSSDDGTKELAESFGFKVLTVPRKKGIVFHESRLENVAIHNATSNFLVDLSIHYNYPKHMDEFCRKWLKNNINFIKEKILILRGKHYNPKGELIHIGGGSWLTYRPYWLAVRGFDERTAYPWVGPYGTRILLKLWNLKIEEHDIGLRHKYHYGIKPPHRRKYFKGKGIGYHLQRGEVKPIVDELIENFEEILPKVHNSYW